MIFVCQKFHNLLLQPLKVKAQSIIRVPERANSHFVDSYTIHICSGSTIDEVFVFAIPISNYYVLCPSFSFVELSRLVLSLVIYN